MNSTIGRNVQSSSQRHHTCNICNIIISNLDGYLRLSIARRLIEMALNIQFMRFAHAEKNVASYINLVFVICASCTK